MTSVKLVVKVLLFLLATPGISWAQRYLGCPGPGGPGARNLPNIDDGPGGSMHGIDRGGGGAGLY